MFCVGWIKASSNSFLYRILRRIRLLSHAFRLRTNSVEDPVGQLWRRYLAAQRGGLSASKLFQASPGAQHMPEKKTNASGGNSSRRNASKRFSKLLQAPSQIEMTLQFTEQQPRHPSGS